jgi:hypothetical protein
MHFFLDHDWIAEYGEWLPVYRPPLDYARPAQPVPLPALTGRGLLRDPGRAHLWRLVSYRPEAGADLRRSGAGQ